MSEDLENEPDEVLGPEPEPYPGCTRGVYD